MLAPRLLWPEQPFPAQHAGCALESCQTSKPTLATAIPHSAAESGLARGAGWFREELEREKWEGRGHARQVTVVSQYLRAALPLPLTLLCLSWCSVSFLGLLAEHCACCFGFASLSEDIRILGEAFRASSVSLSW